MAIFATNMRTRFKEYIQRRRVRIQAWKQMHYWKNKRDQVYADMKAIVMMYPEEVEDKSSVAWSLFVNKNRQHEELSRIAQHYQEIYNKL